MGVERSGTPAGAPEYIMRDVTSESEEDSPYECFDCGTIVVTSDNPLQCDECGGDMRNRRMPIE